MTKEIEALGGQFQSNSSRESMMYQATTYTRDLPAAVSLLSDTVLNPLLTAQELDEQRDSAAWEVRELNSKPDMILPERLHEIAYRGNTLGNPLLCPEDRVETITTDEINEFRSMWYRPDRIVVAGAGVEHDHLVELAERHFGELKASPPSLSAAAALASATSRPGPPPTKPSISKFLSTSASAAASILSPSSSSPVSGPDPNSFEFLSTARANYTGGELYIPDPSLPYTHFYFAWEGLPLADPDIYVLATLQTLLGGGGSFSAGPFPLIHPRPSLLRADLAPLRSPGGPGKGMYSHLYTKVLNQYHAVDHCVAFHHCYIDSSLFGIQIVVNEGFVNQTPHLIATLVNSLTHATRGGIGLADLERAKKQLKSTVAMQLESRIVQVEDLGVRSSFPSPPLPSLLSFFSSVLLLVLTSPSFHSDKPKRSGTKSPWKRWPP